MQSQANFQFLIFHFSFLIPDYLHYLCAPKAGGNGMRSAESALRTAEGNTH